LIDEAGSRVHLANPQQPSAVKELKRELRQHQDKEEAVKAQDFDQAGKPRSRTGIEANCAIAETKDEAKRSELPVVDVEDIAQIVASGLECLSTS